MPSAFYPSSMHDQAQYAAAAHVPLIKSPSLRIPQPVTAPPDIQPLPDDINAYFVYPFTLESHILTLESSRRSTLAAHAAKHEATLKQRAEDKDRRRREALRRVAPGFEPESGPLVPDRVSRPGEENIGALSEAGTGTGKEHARQRSVMDDLVDHLAALDATKASTPDPRQPLA